MRRVLGAASAVIVGALMSAGSAAAQTTNCAGVPAGNIVRGSLIIPANGDCDLSGTLVTGGVRVGKNASLDAEGATIRGSVTAKDAFYVKLCYTSIGGPVSVNGTTDGVIIADQCYGQVGSERPTIGGSVTLTDNKGGSGCTCGFLGGHDGGFVTLFGMKITGSAVLTGNGPNTVVGDNDIGGSLVCHRNLGLTNYGKRNHVRGARVDQCAHLDDTLGVQG